MLSLADHYNTPSFSGNLSQKAGRSIRNFAKNQKTHLFTQGVTWTTMEGLSPSPSFGSAILRKVVFDLGELIGTASAKAPISPKYQATNIFSYIMTGIKKLNKLKGKNKNI